MIRNSRVVRLVPRGLSDAIDSSDAFPGACTQIQNLIFDPANTENLIARPGVGSPITSFAGFSTPGFISVHSVLGSRVYGMIGTARNAGKDEPFCYDTSTAAFISISGVTNANTPTSPLTTGAWAPPTMAVIGTKIIVTHPGFIGSGAQFFGVIDIANPAAPTWTCQNTATFALPGVPSAVANFNNRAYFAVGNQLWYSDPLNAVNMTSANQALTVGDSTSITALSGLPMVTSSAGVLAALIVFKASSTWQVIGDSTTIAQNFMSLSVGCVAPRSVAQTPAGIVFMNLDGHYLVNPLGSLQILANDGRTYQDIRVPFQTATVPSRFAATYAGDIYRICGPSLLAGATVQQDFWFDTHRKRWTGPHTFGYDCASALGASAVLSSAATPGKLFMSLMLDSQSNTLYADNGSALPFNLSYAAIPQSESGEITQIVESTIELGAAGSPVNFILSGQDEQQTTLATANIALVQGGSTWDSGVTFDSGVIYAPISAPRVYVVPWSAPQVASKHLISIQAISQVDLTIGPVEVRIQPTRYSGMY